MLQRSSLDSEKSSLTFGLSLCKGEATLCWQATRLPYNIPAKGEAT